MSHTLPLFLAGTLGAAGTTAATAAGDFALLRARGGGPVYLSVGEWPYMHHRRRTYTELLPFQRVLDTAFDLGEIRRGSVSLVCTLGLRRRRRLRVKRTFTFRRRSLIPFLLTFLVLLLLLLGLCWQSAGSCFLARATNSRFELNILIKLITVALLLGKLQVRR